MGKSDFLSPKAIANRIKSKGLQKLRWYCQMCQKQCRDENGFKCHCMSESHQRQLLLASENPQQFMDYFSEEFRNDFLELLRRRFGTKRVHNNIVYNEYISHREHIHMNATQWETLTDFTKWLGREGLCKVDETPKGWYIQYIDRDPETIRRQQEQERKKKQDLDDEEKTAKFIEQQVRRGLEGKELEKPVYTELNRENEEEKVAFNLNKGASTSIAASSKPSSVLGPNALKMVEGAVKRKESAHSSGQSKEKKKKSALDEIMELEEEKKRTSRRDYWLQPEIIVKIVTKKLGEKYHKKKAVVKEVIDKYTAVVKMIDSGDKLKLDQTHLETVIPAPGKKVMVLNGGYRGNEGILESINEKRFSATIIIDSGPLKGRRVEDIQYEDISKLA
ncbi:DNA/RNA-binding protein KIN17 isoform 1-T1 [Sarcoramphus papa]|uniref:DNA/RNA-binding protein KIN17 isoform X1 n=1 Tax=Gymnogyps californianus TaxID=33616 RepID=UPI0021C76851|nr:DNA/RNA-binding protein KIN17 isoform X1 [Gymnogyps californianus]